MGRDHSGGVSFVALRDVTLHGVCYFEMKLGGYWEPWSQALELLGPFLAAFDVFVWRR